MDPYSPRETRHLYYISHFTSDIHYIAGTDSIPAYALSCHPVCALWSLSSIDLGTMTTNQPSWTLWTSISSCKFEHLSLPFFEGTLFCDVFTQSLLLLLSKHPHHAAFEVLHSLSHPSITATVKLISAWFFWLNMWQSVTAWSHPCLPCQCSKVHSHTQALFVHFQPPDTWFHHMHIDLVGPWPASHGFTYILTCIDWFSRWPEAILLVDISAELAARNLICGWLSCIWVPSRTPLTVDVSFRGCSEFSTSTSQVTILPWMVWWNSSIAGLKLLSVLLLSLVIGPSFSPLFWFAVQLNSYMAPLWHFQDKC